MSEFGVPLVQGRPQDFHLEEILDIQGALVEGVNYILGARRLIF